MGKALRFAFGCAVKPDQPAKHKTDVEKKRLSRRIFKHFTGLTEADVQDPVLGRMQIADTRLA
jgi:hypothetical protein